MPTVHTIRLAGPWGCQPFARYELDEAGRHRETTENLPPAGRLTMPADWSSVCGAGFRGRVLLRRRFHWPTRLMPRERVWLVLDEVCGSAQVWLNDQSLGDVEARAAPWEADITELLEPTNVLIAEVSHSGPTGEMGGLTGEVRLEVRS
jgi:hypothetical protein